ncbi:MAG: DNA polymerase III subunit chi [Gammaproteobacteria bacterium]|nr:DNA polymerase III subunit chi [Gammaproteobacteria bacterium]
MTEVDFYILDAEAPAERKHFACRLADKAFQQGHNVYIHTGDEASAREMDELLWSFRPQSFLPHSVLGGEHDEHVAIGWQMDPAHHNDVMINLSLSVPEFVGRFRRVTEVVVTTPDIRDPLRKSWKYYQDRGYPLNKHDI